MHSEIRLPENPIRLMIVNCSLHYSENKSFFAYVLRKIGVQVDVKVLIKARVRDTTDFLIPGDVFIGQSNTMWRVVSKNNDVLEVISRETFVPHRRSKEVHMMLMDLEGVVVNIFNSHVNSSVKKD